MYIRFLVLFLFFFSSCKQRPSSLTKQQMAPLETIEVKKLDIAPPRLLPLPSYPWEKGEHYLTSFTKDFLSCKGRCLSPCRKVLKQGSYEFVYDCEGGELPEDLSSLSSLLEELSFLQKSFSKKLVITSGYRCKKHLKYCLACKSVLPDSVKEGKSATFFVEGVDLFDEKSLDALSSYKKIGQASWKKKGYLLKLIPPYSQNDPDNNHPYSYFLLTVE